MEDNKIWKVENLGPTHNDSEIDESKIDENDDDNEENDDDNEKNDEYPLPRYTR